MSLKLFSFLSGIGKCRLGGIGGSQGGLAPYCVSFLADPHSMSGRTAVLQAKLFKQRTTGISVSSVHRLFGVANEACKIS